MRVVIGLGNPGTRYERTRHNIGFLVAEALATGGWSAGPEAVTSWAVIADHEVLLVRPLTWMNRSGEALVALREEHGFEPEEVLVVLDDFLLDFGRLRLRRGGSDGGHNGLGSIVEQLGTDAVPRLRLGVGPVPAGEDDIDFVLAPFGRKDDVEGLVERGCAATQCWLSEGIEAAMNRFNGVSALT